MGCGGGRAGGVVDLRHYRSARYAARSTSTVQGVDRLGVGHSIRDEYVPTPSPVHV